MARIRKVSLGIRASSKMFRVSSLAGQIIDEILSHRGKKPLEKEHYSNIGTYLEQGAFAMSNKKLGNHFQVDRQQILFVKDVYDQPDNNISLDNVMKEFSFVWSILDDILKVRDIRRIGIVAEHQVQKDNGNKLLIESLTSLSPPLHPAKFHLTYEERKPTAEGIAPDIKKDNFVNVIYSYYDSEIDADHPTPNAINSNIDLQKYYSPLISSNVKDEISKLLVQFKKKETEFISFLTEKGLV